MDNRHVSRETYPDVLNAGARATRTAQVGRSLRLMRQTLAVDGVPIHFWTAGQGEPVILVHGLSGSIHWWRRNVAALAANHRVYLLDLPGFGSLRRLRRQWALPHAAHWLLRWMDAAAIPQADFIGHSMGGLICLDLAAARPAAVRRLVLAAPALLPPSRALIDEVSPLLRTLRYVRPSFLPILAYDALRAGPLTLLRASRQILRADMASRLRAITAPTLLVWGVNDTLVPPATADLACALLPDARLLLLDRAGHVVMFDRPAAFNAAVTRFLSEASVASDAPGAGGVGHGWRDAVRARDAG